MAPSGHGELKSVMTELFTLLNTLGAIPPGSLAISPVDTGIWPSNEFDMAAASEAGFSDEAVKVLSMLPYSLYDRPIQPSTSTQSYLRAHWDVEHLKGRRDMQYGDLAPPSAIQLTQSEGLVYPWTPIDGPSSDKEDEDNDDTSERGLNYFHVTPISPREAFQPIFDNFCCLRYISVPISESTTELITDDEYSLDPGAYSPELQTMWKQSRDLKAMYLECGWVVGEMNQPCFRRDEFLQRREARIEVDRIVYKARHAR